jgi:hypothetical protein
MVWRILPVVGSDRVASDKVRRRTNNEGHRGIVAVAQYQVEMGRSYGKNGPAQMGINDINVGPNKATDGLAAATFKRAMVTNSHNPVRTRYTHTTYVKAILLGIFT